MVSGRNKGSERNRPRISIICACFNHGRYLDDMLGSVERQTFTDFEVIIVDDGSTDDTPSRLKKIGRGQAEVIFNPHRGPAHARNTAVRRARAEIIMNLDADDRIAPPLLEKAFRVFENYPDAGIVYSDAKLFGARSGEFLEKEYSLEGMLTDNLIISQAFFRKSDWDRVGGYSEAFPHGLEDYDFWLSIIELGREVHRIPETLVEYRTYRRPQDCRSGRRKLSRSRTIQGKLAIFWRHPDLFARFPEIERRFSQLEKKWKSENRFMRWIKEIGYRRTLGRKPR